MAAPGELAEEVESRRGCDDRSLRRQSELGAIRGTNQSKSMASSDTSVAQGRTLATIAVLAYRTISYWLPTIPGAIAYFRLRHDLGSPPVRKPDGARTAEAGS